MIRTVLILKLGAIGDVVMASPMASAIKQLHPGARVTWLVGRTAAPLVRLLPEVDEVVEIDDHALLAGGPRARARSLADAAAALRWRRFDLVLDGHPAPHYRVLEALVRGRRVRRFSRSPGRRNLPVAGRYHGDEYLRLVTGVDGPEMAPAAPVGLDCAPPEALAAVLGRGGKVVALAPGGARNVLADDALRRWPIRRYGELARRLRADGHTVVLTGGAGDEWVRRELPGAGECVDTIGRTSIPELIGLFASSDVVVTHDSGPLHLALAAGAPLVALFGPTNPAEKVPRGNGATVLWGGAGLACRPCYDGRTYAACPSRACIRHIEVDEVQRAVAARIQPR